MAIELGEVCSTNLLKGGAEIIKNDGIAEAFEDEGELLRRVKSVTFSSVHKMHGMIPSKGVRRDRPSSTD